MLHSNKSICNYRTTPEYLATPLKVRPFQKACIHSLRNTEQTYMYYLFSKTLVKENALTFSCEINY